MSFQTIDEFLVAPFGNESPKNQDFEKKYRKMYDEKRIHLVAFTQIDDDYLLHLSVGSDTNVSESYDVVLLFFTDDEAIKKEITFRNYYVKFFSNSPSFIYQYAVLYRQNGFLIDMLYEKMDENYKDVMPDKVNKDHNLSYDKSIYCACKYVLTKSSAFNKYLNFTPKKTPEVFFRGIKDFSDVKMISEIRSMDKKINKELEENKRKQKDDKKKIRRPSSTSVVPKRQKIKAKSNTLKSINQTVVSRPKKKITKKKSTFSNRK